MDIKTLGTQIDFRTIERLDNHGEPCDYCATERQLVEAQIYYTIEEPHEDVFEYGCFTCMSNRVFEAMKLGAYDFQMEVER